MYTKDTKSYTIFDAATPIAITSSTDATPIVVTATSHGFVTGDTVLIFGHTTNVAANGIYKVTRITANTFSLQNRNTGANIAGSGAGAGGATGICVVAPKIITVKEFENININLHTANSANCTLKAVGSLGLNTGDQTSHGDTPNFGATQSPSNPWTYIAIQNIDSGTVLAGSTGIVLTGTDTHAQYTTGTNGLTYFTVIPTAWTAGAISISVLVSN